MSVLKTQNGSNRVNSRSRHRTTGNFGRASVTGGSGGGNLANSRLVSLSGLSLRLKERFLSLQSSPSTSPPRTPRNSETDASSTADSLATPTGSCQSPEATPPLRRRQPMGAQAAQNPAYNCGESVSDKSLSKRHSAPSFSLTDCMEEDSPPPPPDTDLPTSPSRRCLKSAYDSMRHHILYRAFYGWLAYCRHLRTIRTHLACLVTSDLVSASDPVDATPGLTKDYWIYSRSLNTPERFKEVCRMIYFGGCAPDLRPKVWPFLLGLFDWTYSDEHCETLLANFQSKYDAAATEWLAVEAIIRQRDREAFREARKSTTSSGGGVDTAASLLAKDQSLCSDVFDADTETQTPADAGGEEESGGGGAKAPVANGCVRHHLANTDSVDEIPDSGRSTPEDGEGGGIFSKELVDTFAVNLHRIEKDVHRCDRNYHYFTVRNLEKLKHIMCTYVWENLEMGYVQGMCDLAAPLLVTFNDEVLTYGCFCELMKRMAPNFPHGGGMDAHLANMRSLIQVLDPQLFELMQRNGDYTHFYFCYRWFLLDFKRELLYSDVFLVWETIWSARHLVSHCFVLFIALALVQYYREIILENSMDFTDIIKFFNEMAEKHEADAVLQLARDLVFRLQTMIDVRNRPPPPIAAIASLQLHQADKDSQNDDAPNHLPVTFNISDPT